MSEETGILEPAEELESQSEMAQEPMTGKEPDATQVQAQSTAGESAEAGYERAAFDDLQQEAVAPAQRGENNLDVILDIPVTLSMEIGRTRISIQELLQLCQGAVLELDRLAGEPLDVLVNGTLVARGEVVVINDKFGVRLSDVISPAERVNKLG